MRRDSWVAKDGPLAPFVDTFREALIADGHPPGSLKHYFTLMGQLDRWLVAEGLDVSDLSAVTGIRFLKARMEMGLIRKATLASLVPLFEFLRAQGEMAQEPVPVPSPVDRLLGAYRRHLEHDRGLAPTTVCRYMGFARRFLIDRAARTGSDTGAQDLTSAEVNAFMLAAGSRLVVESAKREAADLRALLRYLYLSGLLEVDLGAAMPPVAVWRGRSLPPTMAQGQVDALIDSCDRTTAAGMRDRAMLMLMGRLGLRSGEVVALELGDIDWRAGEIVVRGKARRRDRLPLPLEVGEALVDYLQKARPATGDRHVIISLYAPFRPVHPSSVTSVVYKCCRRAGLEEVGGHRLRHALATEMLRRGGDLLEIAQVLRQSDLGTTAGYAKIDRSALRWVARPWPGVRA